MRCPKCRTILSVEDALGGIVLACPDCTAKMRVPTVVAPPDSSEPIDALEVIADEPEPIAPKGRPRAEAVVRFLVKPRWQAFDVKLPLTLDGRPIAAGSVKEGVDVVATVPVGAHDVAIGGAKHDLVFDEAGHYAVEFQYSAMWGNYSKPPIVRRVSPHATQDWPGLETGIASSDADRMADSFSRRQDDEVLDEIEQLQHQKTGWGSALLILAISLLLYMGAAQVQDMWEGIVIIIPILLFHEAGHYLAMRLFGYRNVRMFFIPFFGAAVSGQNYNIAGWKKAIVALAGPLPGIVAAGPVAIAGFTLQQPELVKASVLMLIVNGFNLLPFLPLDGGWVVHAVLFIRHPVLEAVFRVIAALCLLGVAILMTGWCLIAVAVGMLIATPLSFKLARIAYRLREDGLVARSIDAQSIPPEAARQILAELRRVLPANTVPKVLAQHVVSVFETFNAEPPGALASFGLLFLHAAGFLTALVLSIVILMLQHQA
jgi:Zn-dependent protease